MSATAVPCQVPVPMVPTVVMLAVPAQVDRAVFSTLPSPTMALVMPPTVPVKVGEARLAFRSRALCWDVDTGLLASEVLSTDPSPTSALTSVTTPVFPATLSTAPEVM